MQALCDHTIDSSFCLLNLIVFIGVGMYSRTCPCKDI